MALHDCWSSQEEYPYKTNPEARSLITFFSRFIFLVRDSAVEDRPAYYANTYSRHYRYLIIGGKTAGHAAPFAHLDDGQSRVTLLYFAGWKRAVYRNPLKNSTSSVSRPLISGIRRGFGRHEGRKNQAEGCDSAGLFLSPAPIPLSLSLASLGCAANHALCIIRTYTRYRMPRYISSTQVTCRARLGTYIYRDTQIGCNRRVETTTRMPHRRGICKPSSWNRRPACCARCVSRRVTAE